MLSANYSGAEVDESYAYDANGNRAGQSHVGGAGNRLLADDRYDYEYDSKGNRSYRLERATGVRTQYEWDHRNRLTAVTTRDFEGALLQNAVYAYDVDNRLIARTVDADGVWGDGFPCKRPAKRMLQNGGRVWHALADGGRSFGECGTCGGTWNSNGRR